LGLAIRISKRVAPFGAPSLSFFLLTLAQPYARAAAVLVDESGCVRPNLPLDAAANFPISLL
jgi:hypothetical protein